MDDGPWHASIHALILRILSFKLLLRKDAASSEATVDQDIRNAALMMSNPAARTGAAQRSARQRLSDKAQNAIWASCTQLHKLPCVNTFFHECIR
jgi:hypothetical protein